MQPRHININGKPCATMPALYDKTLLLIVGSIIALGLLMVASSSIVMSEHIYHQAFHFVLRQVVFLCLGIFLGLMLSISLLY